MEGVQVDELDSAEVNMAEVARLGVQAYMGVEVPASLREVGWVVEVEAALVQGWGDEEVEVVEADAEDQRVPLYPCHPWPRSQGRPEQPDRHSLV